jgi:hypothetical protein
MKKEDGLTKFLWGVIDIINLITFNKNCCCILMRLKHAMLKKFHALGMILKMNKNGNGVSFHPTQVISFL